MNKLLQTSIVVVTYIMTSSITIYEYAIDEHRLPAWRKFVKINGCFYDTQLEIRIKNLIKNEINMSSNVIILRELSLVLIIIGFFLLAFYLVL